MNKPSTWIIAALGIVIVFFIMRECSGPAEEKETELKKAYDSVITELKGRMAHVNELQEHAIKSIAERRAKDSIVIQVQDKQIARLKKLAVVQRTPKVDTLIFNNPDLEDFVGTQDKIILAQQVEIDTLKSALEFHRKVNEELITIEFAEDKIEAAMQIEYTRRIAELEKSAKKKQRGNKLLKTLSTVLAGAVLVETVILIAD